MVVVRGARDENIFEGWVQAGDIMELYLKELSLLGQAQQGCRQGGRNVMAAILLSCPCSLLPIQSSMTCVHETVSMSIESAGCLAESDRTMKIIVIYGSVQVCHGKKLTDRWILQALN